jgi:hypothetical protein
VSLGVFVRIPVVFAEVLPPGAIFVVIPVVIILVVLIVDSNLYSRLLRHRDGHDRARRRNGSAQEKRSDVMMCTVHVVFLQIQSVPLSESRQSQVCTWGWLIYVSYSSRASVDGLVDVL